MLSMLAFCWQKTVKFLHWIKTENMQRGLETTFMSRVPSDQPRYFTSAQQRGIYDEVKAFKL